MVSIGDGQGQRRPRTIHSIRRLSRYLLLVAALLGGCASGPKYAEIKNSIPALNPEQGRIYVYRPSALGAAIRPNVLLNGTVIGEMVSHGFFFVDRLPGNYVLSAKTEAEATLSLSLQPNQTQYVKGSMTLGFFVGRPQFELVDATSALMELQDTSYTGTATMRAGAAGTPPEQSAPAPVEADSPSVRLEDLEGLLEENKKGK